MQNTVTPQVIEEISARAIGRPAQFVPRSSPLLACSRKRVAFDEVHPAAVLVLAQFFSSPISCIRNDEGLTMAVSEPIEVSRPSRRAFSF
jgi:hypothetical protein